MGIAVSVTYSITGRGEYQTQGEKDDKKKKRPDFSEVALRVVREATKNIPSKKSGKKSSPK